MHDDAQEIKKQAKLKRGFFWAVTQGKASQRTSGGGDGLARHGGASRGVCGGRWWWCSSWPALRHHAASATLCWCCSRWWSRRQDGQCAVALAAAAGARSGPLVSQGGAGALEGASAGAVVRLAGGAVLM
jgi:hypothetical protein